MKLHFTDEWLKKAIKADPDVDCGIEFRRQFMCEFPSPTFAYVAGHDAARAGVELAACPYHRDDDRGDEWRNGWRDFRKVRPRPAGDRR